MKQHHPRQSQAVCMGRGSALAALAAVLLAAAGLASALAAAAPADKTAAAATGAGDGSLQAAAATVDTSGPAQLVQTAASAMLKQLDAHRADYRKDPSKVHALVDAILLPHFDTDYAAQLVLGKHWGAASDEQRKRFVKAFYNSLLNNYGDALIDFQANKLKVFPFTGDSNAQYATVRSQIRRDDGSLTAVNYSLRRTTDGWKAWDVVIEGISYVKSFRDDFNTEIDQKGLDDVIHRLESGESPAAIQGTHKS